MDRRITVSPIFFKTNIRPVTLFKSRPFPKRRIIEAIGPSGNRPITNHTA
jgi:hypothetical protein